MKTNTTPKPEVLYHFTSPAGLSAILRAGYLALSESKLNISYGDSGVVWLTTSPDPMNHGLKFDDTIPAALDKTSIRILVRYKTSSKQWDEWSDTKGMNKEYKEALIASANAEETYKTWYISEREIPINDFLKLENIAAGETIDIEAAMMSLRDIGTPKVRFQCESNVSVK